MQSAASVLVCTAGVTNKDCLAVMSMNYGGLSWAFVIAAVSLALSQCPTLVGTVALCVNERCEYPYHDCIRRCALPASWATIFLFKYDGVRV